jgi:hypothetical protein
MHTPTPALVERSLAWLVARGHRRVRYRSVERNQARNPLPTNPTPHPDNELFNALLGAVGRILVEREFGCDLGEHLRGGRLLAVSPGRALGLPHDLAVGLVDAPQQLVVQLPCGAAVLAGDHEESARERFCADVFPVVGTVGEVHPGCVGARPLHLKGSRG